MRVLLLLFSITVAILGKTFRNSFLHSLVSFTNLFSNDTTTTYFKDLPFIPLRATYGTPKSQIMSAPRAIRTSFLAVEQSEGVGATVRRSIGVPKLRNFSPFLMLDHFTSTPNSGFPDHPHRGQETM